MSDFYKVFKDGKPAGFPMAKENVQQIHPDLDLDNIAEVVAKGLCEYEMGPPERNESDIIFLIKEYVEGPDLETSFGKWRKNWVLQDRNLTAQERAEANETAMDEIRNMRTYLLKNTDYTALQDSPPMSVEMKEYRQALRDITKNIDDPFNVEWPKNPDDPENRKRIYG